MSRVGLSFVFLFLASTAFGQEYRKSDFLRTPTVKADNFQIRHEPRLLGQQWTTSIAKGIENGTISTSSAKAYTEERLKQEEEIMKFLQKGLHTTSVKKVTPEPSPTPPNQNDIARDLLESGPTILCLDFIRLEKPHLHGKIYLQKELENRFQEQRELLRETFIAGPKHYSEFKIFDDLMHAYLIRLMDQCGKIIRGNSKLNPEFVRELKDFISETYAHECTSRNYKRS